MVKLTIVGRVRDGLPLSQGPVYANEENCNSLRYKEQAEFILKQISACSLPHSNTTVRVDHNSFNYLVEKGVCFITLCDSSYPRKLAFHYLRDLQREFDKFDNSLIQKITRPYSFIKFGGVIRNIRKQYIDTRTQSNLSKLNSKQEKEVDILTLNMSQILETRRTSELPERLMQETSRAVSPIWSSPRLEVIALKWTPITITVVVVSVLLWASLILRDDFIILSF